MFVRRLTLVMLALALPATATVGPLAPNGEVTFSVDLPAGTRYAIVDHAEIRQYRELFVSPEVVAAAKQGGALPDGTILTVVRFDARRDAAGDPIRDTDGRLVKGDLIGYSVMEKHRGWGAELPPELRAGEWRFRAFTADKKVDGGADLAACPQCHQRRASQDFVFSRDRLNAAE